MDLFPFIIKSFEKTAFRNSDLAVSLLPRYEKDRLFIPPELLQMAAEEAFRDMAFYFRENHLSLLAERLSDQGLSGNDRFVIESLLTNAVIADREKMPTCQDTGTAVIYGWKDEGVYTGAKDHEALERGAAAAYSKYGLRFSQFSPRTFFEEFNTGTNLPAQIHIGAVSGNEKGRADPAYRFLFVAKGGGSTNKTSYVASTPALLQEEAFAGFLEEKLRALGTAGCPPYRLAVVAGGSSPEQNLEILKLATAEALDAAPFFGEGPDPKSPLFRDRYWEKRIMEMGRNTGLGAQFGGTSFLLDVRVLRLSRHAATFPLSIGVSCVAHRNILAVIDKNGLRIEQLVTNPAAFLRSRGITLHSKEGALSFLRSGPAEDKKPPRINLDRPMEEVRKDLSALSVGTRIFLSGNLIVARDLAHLKWHGLLSLGKELPDHVRNHPIYYAGPAGTPAGKVIGSLGPTTAQRMDIYAEKLLSRGYSLISLAKGNRTKLWLEACKKYGGFFLGTIGGAAALLAQYVTANEPVEYPELGMEAVRLIKVENLPAFIIIDDKGNDLFA